MSTIASSKIGVRICSEVAPAGIVTSPVTVCHAAPSKNSRAGPKSDPLVAVMSTSAKESAIASTLGFVNEIVKTANISTVSVAVTLSILKVGRSSSLLFGPVPSSMIVPTPTASLIPAPTALDSVTSNDSLCSNKLSLVMLTMIVADC